MISDDTFLLQFLRVRKYRMDLVFKTFEENFLFPHKCPRLYQEELYNFERMVGIVKSGICFPLTHRSDEGQKIILFKMRQWNPEVYTTLDIVRLLLFVHLILLEEEETQIAGIKVIFDVKETTLNQIPSLNDAVDTVRILTHGVARQKGFYMVNLSSFANHLISVFTSLMSEKLKKRVVTLQGIDQLNLYFDVSLLPKEYGGERTEAEMLEDFMELIDLKKEIVQKHLEFRLEFRNIAIVSTTDNKSGSFRKLEVD